MLQIVQEKRRLWQHRAQRAKSRGGRNEPLHYISFSIFCLYYLTFSIAIQWAPTPGASECCTILPAMRAQSNPSWTSAASSLYHRRLFFHIFIYYYPTGVLKLTYFAQKRGVAYPTKFARYLGSSNNHTSKQRWITLDAIRLDKAHLLYWFKYAGWHCTALSRATAAYSWPDVCRQDNRNDSTSEEVRACTLAVFTRKFYQTATAHTHTHDTEQSFFFFSPHTCLIKTYVSICR